MTREPLLHFLVLGVLVVVADRCRTPAPARPTIVVTEREQAMLAQRFRDRQGRIPDDDERRRLIDAWVDEEVLFREGVAYGLDVADPEIRERVVRQVQYLHRKLADTTAPTEAELEQFFAEHRDRYTLPVRYDVEQLFVPAAPGAATQAAALLARVEAGEDPTQLGAGHRAGRRLRRRSRDALAREIDARFADAVVALAPGRWTIVAADDGVHVVRVGTVHPAETPPWSELRTTIERDVRTVRSDRALSAETASLRARYTIQVEPAR